MILSARVSHASPAMLFACTRMNVWPSAIPAAESGRHSSWLKRCLAIGSRQIAAGGTGHFSAAINGNGQTATAPSPPQDPIQAIARQKGVSPESLRVFGAKAITPFTVRLPAYGPDGKQCTRFDLSVRGGKGMFASGKPAGLFFPHEADNVRLPQAGETWHLVEGPKDAAALHSLGLLACGLNTCRLAAKFARLFKGMNVILIPDRDSAGEEGAQYSTRVLRGVASSLRVAVLPAEFKESNGEDVRDVLRRPDGRELVLQAIIDAQPVQQASASSPESEDERRIG